MLLPTKTTHTYSFSEDEAGAATAWSIFWLMAFLVTAGLIIDTSNAFRYKNALQASANASALAAIVSYKEKPKFDAVFVGAAPTDDVDRGKIAGHELANINMDPADNISTVTPKTEVTMGYWDTASATFYPEGTIPSGQVINAAKARALRTVSNSNPLNLLLVDIFGAVSTWDVGESAIAMTFKSTGCPAQEGVMANLNLNFASNNVFQGDLCLHGELAADFNANSEWRANSDGELPVVSYGVHGGACKGFDNCKTEAPYDNLTGFQSTTYPLTDDMIVGAQSRMPDLDAIYRYYEDTIGNPAGYTAASVTQNRYIPPQLVTNPGRDPDTEAAVIRPLPNGAPILDDNGNQVVVAGVPQFSETLGDIYTRMYNLGASVTTNGGVLRISINGRDFEKAVDNADGTGVSPFPPHSIVEVDYNSNCSAQGQKVTLDSDTPLANIVIATSCRFEFNGANPVVGSFFYSNYAGNNTSMQGNEGAILGNGTCDDNTLGSTFVVGGRVHFASGVSVHSSKIIAMGDVTIAAQADAMRGSQVMGNQNVSIQAQAGWQGCENGISYTGTIDDFYYRLVQ